MNLEEQYGHLYEDGLVPVAAALEEYLLEIFVHIPRIDRISARAKQPVSFLKKALKKGERGNLKYEEPFEQIQDQIGARIIVFYKSDVEYIESIIRKYFHAIEIIDRIPQSDWEFSYFGRHLILLLNADQRAVAIDVPNTPKFFELQIKTLFQHAWSEAGHDIAYKAEASKLDKDQQRRLAFTSAQAWGADRIFEELYRELSSS